MNQSSRTDLRSFLVYFLISILVPYIPAQHFFALKPVPSGCSLLPYSDSGEAAVIPLVADEVPAAVENNQANGTFALIKHPNQWARKVEKRNSGFAVSGGTGSPPFCQISLTYNPALQLRLYPPSLVLPPPV